MVVNIDDKEQLIRFLTEASSRPGGPGLVVLDFFATWCRPCSEIAPVFSSLSETHTEARFLKVDVDKNDPDLSPFLDTTQCECLNEDDTHPLSNLISSETGDGYLLSDTDAQLIIFITFAQFVRLHCGPKTVKLFVNQTSTPDFSACESADAVQTLELETKDLIDGAIVPLNFVKFQNVTTITVFVADNQTGKEVTRIDRLRFFGTCVNTTNMQNFK
ncbi:thioredoxin, partial [Opisthorchis viverrini]